jgi:formylglycine-generating enzyme required for sulfatase activity
MKKILLFLLIIILLAGCSSDTNVTLPLIYDPGIDPDSWALIPAGEFLFGQYDEEVLVDYDYEMMVTHVTNAQYADYLNEALAAGYVKFDAEKNEILGYYPGDVFREYRHEEEIAAGDWVHIPLDGEGLKLEFANGTFSVISGYENHPMVGVSWFGAKAYCQYYSWDLPTEVEWEKAARGTNGLPYPWGNDIERENANFYSSRDAAEEVNGRQGDTTPVGFYNGMIYDGYQTIDSPSPYGLYDMAGNVEQWTGDVHNYQHYRYMRGGSKMLQGFDLRVWFRNNAGPDYSSQSIGFRCANILDN